MNTHTQVKPNPPSLPATTVELSNLRNLKSKRTINDLVEDVLVQLWEDETFQSYIYAVYDEQAVEGSLAFDNYKAAEMIRDTAKKKGSNELAKMKAATIAKAMGIVLRRYNQSRNIRRNMVSGVVVTPASNNGTE